MDPGLCCAFVTAQTRRHTGQSIPGHLAGSSGMCTTLLGGYWGVLGPEFCTVGPKRRPGAQNGARPQPALCQAGRNVGYKSACQVLETARNGSRRRPDFASCSPPLKQATSRSKPRKIEASGAILSGTVHTLAIPRRLPSSTTCGPPESRLQVERFGPLSATARQLGAGRRLRVTSQR